MPTRVQGFLQREADSIAPKSLLKQSQQSPIPPSPHLLEDALSSSIVDASPIKSPSSPTLSSIKQAMSRKGSTKTVRKEWKEPEYFEVLKAIEKKDIMYLMEIRDRAFHLLVRPSGGVPPLVHAMRIGKSHNEVAIVLLGAFSRFVNHLSDEDFQTKATKDLLKSLRISLKQAIDFGLYVEQSDLIASFMQTLIMSEGDQWVVNQVADVSLALRSGTAGKPVSVAQKAVRRFATKELGKAKSIAALEDYVANATADLLMMGVWQIALDTIDDDALPYYYFARDDRVYKAFIERLDRHKGAIQRTLSRRAKWQIRVLRTGLEGRNTTWRSKVELLAAELDEGAGV
ncbi:uncharacterized protein STEHIDRAFT_110059 [Stereum hirsutum FP-91666 SS1]|uniref:uncharacterized protein n=1 Tax=Stereum hirsutum (strain FP-91666) TaxID=721885 RepID=UPI000440BE51|nr:uncharacterized protein STEHIDRAFT_110059 [Stereum hirsutum FP-91666 SS1]EIM88281.1 hypothetical protein STEHIDRAFT_110059 [Stereum hirsutum FP-91666 SS1]